MHGRRVGDVDGTCVWDLKSLVVGHCWRCVDDGLIVRRLSDLKNRRGGRGRKMKSRIAFEAVVKELSSARWKVLLETRIASVGKNWVKSHGEDPGLVRG